jgi:hypothetical protein
VARLVRAERALKEVGPMRFDTSPGSILLLVAVVLFVLSAFGVSLGTVGLVPLGLAAFAASFIFGRR